MKKSKRSAITNMGNSMKRMLMGILLLNTVPTFSQQATPAPLPLSIQQAIDLGLKNRYDVQSKKYQVSISQNEILKSRQEWLPEISGAGNVRYSPQLQATYIPGGFLSPDPLLTALGAKSITTFGLDLNQTIFKPSIATGVKIAQNNAAIAQEKNREEENAVKEQIVIAYLNVNLKKLQHHVAIQEELRFKEYAELSEGRFKLGTLLEIDYLKSKLDYENAKVETLKAKQHYDLAVLNVKYQINVPEVTEIMITDTLNAVNFNAISTNVTANTTNRTEIKQLLLTKAGLQLEMDKTKQANLPTVAFYANYSLQFAYKNFDYTIGQWWSPFNYIGLQLKVPITSNYKNLNNIQQQEMKLLQNDLDLKQKTADVDYEIKKASAEVANAQQNMQVTRSNYNLSETIYNSQKEQYGLGARPYSDLLESNRSFSQTEQNYIKAVYDYLIATVNYLKAVGTF